MVRNTLQSGRFVITVEEGTRLGGFGSAFLECAAQQGLDTRTLKILALPDEFIEHGDRDELLHDHGLSADAIANVCRELTGAAHIGENC
jgi:1-deoxy-D-xylulose-5-phosphate synthase